MIDEIKNIKYKIKDYESLTVEKSNFLLNSVKAINGVLDAKLDNDGALEYIVDASKGDYEIFSALMTLLDEQNVELVFDDEESIVREEIDEENVLDDIQDDDIDEEAQQKKDKKYEKIEKIVVMAISAVLIAVGFVLEKMSIDASMWLYMFGFAFAGYETLYALISDVTEKKYFGEKIIVLASSFVLLYFGYARLLSCIMIFAYSLISCMYSAITCTDNDCLDDEEKAKLKVLENEKNKMLLVYDVCLIVIGLLISFLVPLISINQYWSLFTTKWLSVGVSVSVIGLCGNSLKSVAFGYEAAKQAAIKFGTEIGGNVVLDKLSECEKICFDKTGVITQSEGIVVKTEGDENELAKLVVSAENGLCSPIAKTLLNYFSNVEPLVVENLKYEEGRGVSYILNGQSVQIGSKKFLNDVLAEDINDSEFSTVYVCVEKKYVGAIYLDFPIKEDINGAITELKEDISVSSELISSDSIGVVNKIKREVNFKHAVFGASAKYKKEYVSKDKTIYVGETSADDNAASGLDNAVLFNAENKRLKTGAFVNGGDVKVVPQLVKLAKRMKNIKRQNRFIGVVFKAVAILTGVLLTAFLGYKNAMTVALLIATVGEIIVFFNSYRNATEVV